MKDEREAALRAEAEKYFNSNNYKGMLCTEDLCLFAKSQAARDYYGVDKFEQKLGVLLESCDAALAQRDKEISRLTSELEELNKKLKTANNAYNIRNNDIKIVERQLDETTASSEFKDGLILSLTSELEAQRKVMQAHIDDQDNLIFDLKASVDLFVQGQSATNMKILE